MSETIEARELQLVNIFSDNYRFEIPEYQRPYAWTTEQTGEFLDALCMQSASYQSTDKSESINKYLRYLDWLDNFDLIPPAMAFYSRNHCWIHHYHER